MKLSALWSVGEASRFMKALAFGRAEFGDPAYCRIAGVEVETLIDSSLQSSGAEENWEYSSEVTSRTIDVHIPWLRQKIETDPQSQRHIQTVRSKGYRFTA